mmetsp:Transcript_21723/g.37019  ORF Transcript_21723/g.37019 Transcript_21723/m.37019 type:complete len:325 (-) Transcript_21723:717-1691(-)|eukprot:CAMPEP_0119103982 /NCGR_PEP_ID=MMETSP1180-20130426/2312_1 /TAXON_ID=3052 ORGANISM="Chlamydomonas cf sp, Strain CCMP681" /NCGR_SAMPLE_ID=MMETSP1180 /ASSEMBLY_ACC=CAM_ASM_000741 /LENGTH=324 /DNA_ID=CAMNT_0007088625 /DNA_START=93 /DNA_END=1067 /DNA_ORIENTATION=-
MAQEGAQTVAELTSNLAEYKDQLKQVQELLLMGGGGVDPEMQEMYDSLREVIQLTEDLLKEAAESEAAAAGAAASAEILSNRAQWQKEEEEAGGGGASAPIITPPSLNLPSILPASVAEHIRKMQIRAALTGQAPASWLIGAKLQAMYPADGVWYDAVVESASGGKLTVLYEGYADKEEVTLSSLREPPEVLEVYTGVAAPKRKRVEEQPAVTEMPKWLEILPGDDEKMVLRKKKLIKSFKSKMRFQNMDMTTKNKQDNWKDFMSGKGTKKKTGFFTGRKKDSIFSVGDGVNSKVGVTGSGQAMTEYQKIRIKTNMPDGSTEDA